MIDVESLCYTYPGAAGPAVRDLSFEVADGEIFGFLGPSGAGKSTVQKILIRLLRGFEGKVRVRGRDIGAWDQRFFERVGVAFEFPTHFNRLSGRENLHYYARLYRGPTVDVDRLLDWVALTDDGDKRVEAYSKGMKTRLGVARSLLNDPELVFLDEPTAGLDPVNARSVRRLIREQCAGRTVFLTTHDMTVADELCDRVAFIVDGQIRAIDSPRALKLAHGQRTLRLEHRRDGALHAQSFPLDTAIDDPAFVELMRSGAVETVHSQEANLEDVFVRVTGQELR